jgi:hypothetical protein
VYGDVFRNGPSFDVSDIISEANATAQVKWIMCKNENAIENHLNNKQKRDEMFDDMTDIIVNFSIFEMEYPELNWIDYDYEKLNMTEFVEGLIK